MDCAEGAQPTVLKMSVVSDEGCCGLTDVTASGAAVRNGSWNDEGGHREGGPTYVRRDW